MTVLRCKSRWFSRFEKYMTSEKVFIRENITGKNMLRNAWQTKNSVVRCISCRWWFLERRSISAVQGWGWQTGGSRNWTLKIEQCKVCEDIQWKMTNPLIHDISVRCSNAQDVAVKTLWVILKRWFSILSLESNIKTLSNVEQSTLIKFNLRVWSWLRTNAGGVLNTCKLNGIRSMKCNSELGWWE